MPGARLPAVRVSVPATSANLGPGFDALGLAVDLRDELLVRVVGDGVPAGQWVLASYAGVSVGEDNLVLRAMRATFAEVGWTPPELSARFVPRVPMSRGLGSSAAAICAGVTAALALAGGQSALEGQSLATTALPVAARLEGHPDNVAACLLGGLTIARTGADHRVEAVRLEPAAELSAVAVIPVKPVSTSASRGVLPAQVEHAAAARTAGRAALLVAALTSRPDQLLAATEDWLHQPYRLPALRLSSAVLEAWRAAGIPAFLSGSGPTVLALVRDVQEQSRATALAEETVAGAPNVADGSLGAHGMYQASVVALALDRAGTRWDEPPPARQEQPAARDDNVRSAAE